MREEGVRLSGFERELVAALAEGLPLEERPYLALARRLGVTEEEVLRGIRDLVARGVIRRFGATVRHDRSGYAGNAMVAWLVPEERVEEVGRALATSPCVTHCYLRRTAPDWPYNLYTMVHAEDEAACLRLVRRLAEEMSLTDYEVLFTEKEIVRRTRKYFSRGPVPEAGSRGTPDDPGAGRGGGE